MVGGSKKLAIIVRSDDVVSAMHYPGGKSRCFQKLINLIPPHRVYIESHLGSGAVLRHKAAAIQNIGIDPDPAVISRFSGFPQNYQFWVGRIEDVLPKLDLCGDEFIYADPPYWPSSRRSSRRIYAHEYSDLDHVALLQMLTSARCRVMISGYENSTYDRILGSWEKISFWGTSQVGRRKESVWLNYTPELLHDTRFLGDTFHRRQAIKRKRERWKKKFQNEPLAVQQAILEDLKSCFAAEQP